MRNPQDMRTAPDSPAKKSSEAVDPAATKEQDHVNSKPNSTAFTASVGRLHASDKAQPRPIGEILRELFDIRSRAQELLRIADPVAVELYQEGFRAGTEEGERRAAERAERAADDFLSYLAEDPSTIPGRIPPLEHYRGAAA